jgi:hypothetical protein
LTSPRTCQAQQGAIRELVVQACLSVAEVQEGLQVFEISLAGVVIGGSNLY